MGDYSSSSTWIQVAMKLVLVGFVMELFAFSSNIAGATEASRALQVCGFISMLVAEVLLFYVIYLNALNGNFIAEIFVCIFCFLGGLFVIIGVAVHAGHNRGWGRPGPGRGRALNVYSTSLAISGAIFYILGGVFIILELCGVGSGGGSGGTRSGGSEGGNKSKRTAPA